MYAGANGSTTIYAYTKGTATLYGQGQKKKVIGDSIGTYYQRDITKDSSVTPIGTECSPSTFYKAGLSKAAYTGDGDTGTLRGDSTGFYKLGSSATCYKIADSGGSYKRVSSITRYERGDYVTLYKGNGGSIHGRGAIKTYTLQGESVSAIESSSKLYKKGTARTILGYSEVSTPAYKAGDEVTTIGSPVVEYYLRNPDGDTTVPTVGDRVVMVAATGTIQEVKVLGGST